MTLAEIIPSILNALVTGRVYEDATPDNLARDGSGNILPFIVWSRVGGMDSEYVDQTMSDKRHARIQILSIAPGSIVADQLDESVLQAMLASTYTVGVNGSPGGTYDAPRKLRGRRRQFSIWFHQSQ